MSSAVSDSDGRRRPGSVHGKRNTSGRKATRALSFRRVTLWTLSQSNKSLCSFPRVSDADPAVGVRHGQKQPAVGFVPVTAIAALSQASNKHSWRRQPAAPRPFSSNFSIALVATEASTRKHHWVHVGGPLWNSSPEC